MKTTFTNVKQMMAVTIMGTMVFFSSCSKDEETTANIPVIAEDIASFKEISQVVIGGGKTGAAEITAYDTKTQKLFVVNNAEDEPASIDVIDISDPSNSSKVGNILLSSGAGNSVATYNGLLAIALENDNKQANGTIAIYNTEDLSQITSIEVGALPDMVTFSPDGAYIVCANEGEPNDDYTIDPEGSISIISVNENYAVSTIGFDGFISQESNLASQGFRIFGKNASFTQDIEPEYVTISSDSKTAWVALQENNGIAKVDLASKQITDIFPLGLKDYSLTENGIDINDKDDQVSFQPWANVVGMYQPDAIAYFETNGTAYIISANEGDSRDYDGFSEEVRAEDVTLDPTAFPAETHEQLERLKITNAFGDTDNDGDFDVLYSYGARSFTIWTASTGNMVYDSKNQLEQDLIANSNLYPDDRSDDKGVEPEGVTVGQVNGKTIAFIGLERADAVVTYDISNPASPILLQVLETGDAPEGVLFIPASESPSGNSLFVVSSEDDGTVKIFQASSL